MHTPSITRALQSCAWLLACMLITALVHQIPSTATDAAHGIAGTATPRLLSAGAADGLLPGPRSPMYGRK